MTPGDSKISLFIDLVFTEEPLPAPNSDTMAILPFLADPQPKNTPTNYELCLTPGWIEDPG